ncbi:MAG: DUF2905 domain-containing protein [Bacteroidota bacterium]
MNPQPALARQIIIAGVLIFLTGLYLLYGYRLPQFLRHFGRLPGDISFDSKTGSFRFPIVTCLLISALLSLLMWLWRRFVG